MYCRSPCLWDCLFDWIWIAVHYPTVVEETNESTFALAKIIPKSRNRHHRKDITVPCSNDINRISWVAAFTLWGQIKYCPLGRNITTIFRFGCCCYLFGSVLCLYIFLDIPHVWLYMRYSCELCWVRCKRFVKNPLRNFILLDEENIQTQRTQKTSVLLFKYESIEFEINKNTIECDELDKITAKDESDRGLIFLCIVASARFLVVWRVY